MRKMLKWMLVCMILAVGTTGCITRVDPVTGEQTVGIDPNVAAQIETGAQASVSMLMILGSLWPVLIPIGAGLAAALGTWAKVKPKLIEAQSEATMYHSATQSVVTAIEDFKAHYPNDWAKLEENLRKSIGPKAENVIRAIRGKPPKE